MAHNPLRILQVVSGRDLNGALTYVKSLSERLVARGHQITVACRRDCWLRTQALSGVAFVESNLDRTFSEVRRLSRWVADHEIDIIHTHMSRAHLMGVILRCCVQAKVVATAHSCNFQPHWRMNDYVIANSAATLRYHRWVNWINPRRSSLAYCFTDLQRFSHLSDDRAADLRLSMGVASDEYLIGMVGQVCDRKGQRTLFEALPELARRLPNFKLVMLGPCYEASDYVQGLRRHLDQHALSDRVIWAGATDDVAPYMSAFDLCVVPSNKEPLGLVAVESLAAGTPIIASDVGGLPEIVRHEQTGLLVPRGQPRRLAAAIVRAATSSVWMQRLTEVGRDRVYSMFDAERLTDQVESIYGDLARNARGERKLRRERMLSA